MTERNDPMPQEGETVSAEVKAPTPEGFVSIEDLAAKINEAKADETTILELIVEAAGSIPVPDPEDTEAAQEYDRRQEEILKYARERFGRTVFIKELEEWIEQKSHPAS